jgi:hypothetical protein
MTAALGPRYPPSFVWDGNPADVIESARAFLALNANDPDMARLAQVTDAAIELCRQYLDSPVPFDDLAQDAPIPAPVFQAAVFITVEGYRRKDATFGLSGSFTADGIPVRISNDWLAPALNLLAPYKDGWGLA